MEEQSFWSKLQQLITTSAIIIDRPKGSSHPTYPDLIYPFDYGFLAGTSGGDGGGIDLWRGSEALPALRGIIATVDLVKRDTELKLLLGCSQTEMQTIHNFHNRTNVMGGLLIIAPK
jgi:inorganic pyrophosphatase